MNCLLQSEAGSTWVLSHSDTWVVLTLDGRHTKKEPRTNMFHIEAMPSHMLFKLTFLRRHVVKLTFLYMMTTSTYLYDGWTCHESSEGS